jgi:hypothetical protein
VLNDGVPTLDLHAYFGLKGIGSLNQEQKPILFRRSRAPRLEFDKAGLSILSRSGSDGARNIFTGQFGSADLNHTLGDAFEGISTNPIASFAVKALNSTLLNYVLLDTNRKELVKLDGNAVVTDDAAIERIANVHQSEVESEKLIKNARNAKSSTDLFVSFVQHANQVDHALWFENKRLDSTIGGVLLKLAALVEAETQNCNRLDQMMNQSPQDLFYLASDNLDSAESISTHSLMSKDSVRKEPLRKETDALARYAVGISLQTLLSRTQLQKSSPYVDWADFLRRLLCHPVQAPGNWATQFVVKGTRPQNSLFMPATIPAAGVQQRVEQSGRVISRLQQSYNDLYQAAAADWSKLVT